MTSMTCKTCNRPADRPYMENGRSCSDPCHVIGSIVETCETRGTYLVTGHWRGYCALEDTRYPGSGIGFKASPRGVYAAGSLLPEEDAMTVSGEPGDRYFAVCVWNATLGRNYVATVQEDSAEDARAVVERRMDRNAGEKVEWVSQLVYEDQTQADALADMFNAGYEQGYRDCTEGWIR